MLNKLTGEYYREHIYKPLEALNIARGQSLKHAFIIHIIIIALMCILRFFNIIQTNILIAGLCFYLIIIIISAGHIGNRYAKLAKDEIQDNILKVFGNMRMGIQTNFVSDYVPLFDLLVPDFTTWETLDSIYGEYNGWDVQAQEIRMYASIYTRRGETEITSFRGVIIEFRTNKPTSYGQVLIWNNAFLKNRLPQNTIAIGNPDFDRRFKLFTNNIGIINKLMKPKFISYLNKLDKRYHDVTLSMNNGKIALIIRTNKNMFEITKNIFIPLTNVAKIQDYFEDVASLVNLVDAIEENNDEN